LYLLKEKRVFREIWLINNRCREKVPKKMMMGIKNPALKRERESYATGHKTGEARTRGGNI
jgi:hypothetical protein